MWLERLSSISCSFTFPEFKVDLPVGPWVPLILFEDSSHTCFLAVFKSFSQSPQSFKDNWVASHSITTQQHQPALWALVGVSYLRIHRLVYVQFAKTWSSFTKGAFTLFQIFPPPLSGAQISWRTVFTRRLRQGKNWLFQPSLPCPVQQQVHIFTTGFFVTFVLTEVCLIAFGI